MELHTRCCRQRYKVGVGLSNIIQIHNSVMWDLQYSKEYSHSNFNVGKYHRILLVTHNIVMDLNNVM